MTIAHLVLKNNEPYWYAQPERVRAKLRHVERAVEASCSLAAMWNASDTVLMLHDPKDPGRNEADLFETRSDEQVAFEDARDHRPLCLSCGLILPQELGDET